MQKEQKEITRDELYVRIIHALSKQIEKETDKETLQELVLLNVTLSSLVKQTKLPTEIDKTILECLKVVKEFEEASKTTLHEVRPTESFCKVFSHYPIEKTAGLTVINLLEKHLERFKTHENKVFKVYAETILEKLNTLQKYFSQF